MADSFMHHDNCSGANEADMTAKKRRTGTDATRLRRMYIDCRYGQLHLTTAYPASGGFDEASPLVFLHAEHGSGADFNRCAALLGSNRSVYAPDLPGSGASDAPSGRLSVAGLAAAIADLVEQLRLRRVDLFGCGRGAQVAFELAATRPQEVRRLIVAGQTQPTPASSKPVLVLEGDPARFLKEPADAIFGQLRAFLDRA
jgi:pimeloyl-ACP methyl ester carboxylesterase